MRSIETLSIDSTVLCCNFVNTVSSWKTVNYYDYLQTYEDFIAWCIKLEIFNSTSLDKLKSAAISQPAEALAALKEIKEIRQMMQTLISAIALDDKEKREFLLPEFNLLLVKALSKQRLLYLDGKFILDQDNTAEDFIAPIWKAVYSLADLVTKNDIKRVKECPKCGWVFLDETKNAGRKWCNPKYCGTSDKMMRYNKRKKDVSGK